jgi:hypothetical protein
MGAHGPNKVISSARRTAPFEMKKELGIPLLVALGCVFFDVYVMGIPTTLWALILAIAVRLVQIFRSLLAKNRSLAAVRAKRIAIHGAAIVLIGLGVAGNVKLAASRGSSIAEAVKRYRAATGNYPERLEQLVPSYLPAIPDCCIRSMMPKFRYLRLPDRPHPTLFWVAVPPFGKGTYDFERDRLRPLWD